MRIFARSAAWRGEVGLYARVVEQRHDAFGDAAIEILCQHAARMACGEVERLSIAESGFEVDME